MAAGRNFSSFESSGAMPEAKLVDAWEFCRSDFPRVQLGRDPITLQSMGEGSKKK